MTSTGQLPQLHDAVLERVEIDWDAATATLEVVRVPGGPTRLICSEVVAFQLTRRQEWGPSVYVNTAQLRPAADGSQLLRIEMQSGDEMLTTFGELEVVGESSTTDAGG